MAHFGTVGRDDDNSLVISENRGLYSRKINYVIRSRKSGEYEHEQDNVIEQVIHGVSKSLNLIDDFKLAFKQIFLPHGYPDSVSKDYMSYQIYDTIQAFCSSLTGALATEAVMKGVGVGDELATPLAAALTWLLKNGSGMIGQMVFTWCKGTSLDGDCKKWRFFADVVNDTAIFIDLLTPALDPDIRIAVFCVSSVARSLVGVAGGATRAAITQHQARMNNSADVSAKDGSQETLVNLVALLVSLITLPLVSGNHLLVWTLYLFFTFFHLLANYKALKSLQLESLNKSRLLYCIQSFLKNGKVSSVTHVNKLESVVIGFGIRESSVTSSGYSIRLGVSVHEALATIDYPGKTSMYSYSLKHFRDLINDSEDKSFLVVPDFNRKIINVILHENIPPWELLEAYCRAVFLTHHHDSHVLSGSAMDKMCTNQWRKLQSGLISQGYARDRALLETGDWRASWKKSYFLAKIK